MTNNFKSLSILFFLSCICFSSIYAQNSSGRKGGQGMNMGHFYGKILDASTSKPIEAASVQLIQNKFDTVSKKKKDVIVAGMLTDKRGEFSLENLAVMGAYKLKITAIGYTSYESKVAFDINPGMAKNSNGDLSNMLNAIDKDLGNIKLKIDAQQLENVTVTATKPLLTMGIDRKIYNVEKDITAAGGTGIDVMKNVPSVSVDLDGNVSLRNATPQIFVDGRPSTMTLDQIPADAISSIEIITNPSAKFDASGGGAGILNIVLKKNRKVGYNGNIRAGIDSRARPNVGGNINVRQGKINVFASGALNFRKSISTQQTTRTDFLKDNATAELTQNNKPIGEGFFGFGRAGVDYFIDNRNTISISGNYTKGQFKSTDLLNVNRDTLSNLGSVSDYGNRSTSGDRHFQNYGGTVSFKHNFAKSGKDITADVNYNYSNNTNNNDYATQYFFTNGDAKTQKINERFLGGGTNSFFTSQIDYEDPLTPNIKIEAGGRIALRKFTSYNDNFIKDATSGEYYALPLLNNQYEFTDRVLAGYFTFSQKIKNFSYQLGLRGESSKYDGDLISKSQTFSNEFPITLFPSVFATYKINDKQDMQLNYSRKINRPNFFQLIPFIDFTDSLNLSKGNPGLVPEFTNMIELSHQYQFNKNHNILTSLYYKNTENLITRYQYKDANPNPDKIDSVIMTTYANANRSYQYGLELTAKNTLVKWWDITTNLNFFNGVIKAGNLTNGVDNEQFSWFGKMNHNFKMPKNYSAQISFSYQSKTLIPPSGGGGGRNRMSGGMMGPSQQTSAQGYINEMYDLDISFKKEFLKNNAASISLQFNDPFRVRKFSSHSESIYFVQDNIRRQDPQVVRLNFNLKFGKMDVSLFKRKNMKESGDDNQNIQGM